MAMWLGRLGQILSSSRLAEAAPSDKIRFPISWLPKPGLRSRLSRIPALRIPLLESHIEPAYYRFYVFVRPERLRPQWDRDAILHAINEEGVPCFSGSCGEVYLEKAFEQWRPEFRRPVAQELAETSLAFPVHSTLSDRDMEDVCQAVEKVMACAS